METQIEHVEHHIRGLGHDITEGSASAHEMCFLAGFVRRHVMVGLVAEIGFNAGLSATAFLLGRQDVRVVSFDSMDHGYVQAAKALVDGTFGGRHELVGGDSKTSVPQYAKRNPGKVVDFLFVDGGHDFTTALTDLTNGALLAHPGTVVMIDDLTPWEWWGEGPTLAWERSLSEGLVVQDSLYRNGRRVTEVSGHPGDRLWAVGHYTRKALQRHVSERTMRPI